MIRTESELLFEALCERAGIPCRSIAPRGTASLRTADFELGISEPPVLVEVKQIDPNPDEATAQREALAARRTAVFSDTPGRRLRPKISEAAAQLRACCAPDQAGLVVIYNNVWIRQGLTDHHNIMAAMYGRLQIRITTFEDPTRPALSEPGLGGNRGVTPDQNTVISALGILFGSSEEPRLDPYHNDFAAVRLELSRLRTPLVHQFRLVPGAVGVLPSWYEV